MPTLRQLRTDQSISAQLRASAYVATLLLARSSASIQLRPLKDSDR